MGRHKGYKHSEATKRKIAMRTKEALSGQAMSESEIQEYIEPLPEPLRNAISSKLNKLPTAPQAGQDATTAPSHEGHAAGPAVAVVPKDALDALVAGPVKDIVALMLWKNRHNEPELNVQITDRDLAGFKACVEYLHVTPEVRIVRPQGTPGHGGIPATRTRSAIPPQEATPPKPYVIVTLVERGTENSIKAVENNEEDFAAAAEAREFRHARDVALQIASQLQRDAATGNFSSSTIDEAARVLVALAK